MYAGVPMTFTHVSIQTDLCIQFCHTPDNRVSRILQQHTAAMMGAESATLHNVSADAQISDLCYPYFFVLQKHVRALQVKVHQLQSCERVSRYNLKELTSMYVMGFTAKQCVLSLPEACETTSLLCLLAI